MTQTDPSGALTRKQNQPSAAARIDQSFPKGVAMEKQVIIIAGPNGAGKTTFARIFLAPLKDSVRFINADYIAAGLSPFDSELVAVRAGKIMLEEVEACYQKGESFAIETTLSGRGYLKHIKR